MFHKCIYIYIATFHLHLLNNNYCSSALSVHFILPLEGNELKEN